MTLITNPELLQRYLETHPVPATWSEVQEADFTPSLHPRDRRGQFRRVLFHGTNFSQAAERGLTPSETGLVAEKKAVYLTDSEEEAKQYGGFVYAVDTKGLDVRGPVDDFATEGGQTYYVTQRIPPERVTAKVPTGSAGGDFFASAPIDAEVETTVTDRGSAVNYFEGKLGIKARFGDMEASPLFWQEIVQAVKDMEAKYPVVKEGPNGPFEGIGSLDAWKGEALDHVLENFLNPDEDWAEVAASTWAVTSRDPEKGSVNIPFGKDKPMWITLVGNANGDWLETRSSEFAIGGGAAPVGRDPYGRVIHELAHVVAANSGLDFYKEGKGAVKLLEEAELSPGDITSFSPYASQYSNEAWAEIWASLNREGELDQVDSDLVRKFEKLRKAANRWAKQHDVPGDIL